MISTAQSAALNITAPLPSQEAGQNEGDELLRQIARAGRHWKRTMTRKEDMESTSLLLAPND